MFVFVPRDAVDECPDPGTSEAKSRRKDERKKWKREIDKLAGAPVPARGDVHAAVADLRSNCGFDRGWAPTASGSSSPGSPVLG